METKYEDSLFYIISSCSKYFTMLFEQFIKELNVGISATEHLALKVIKDTKDCSQRDLARIILKDRAGTGKLASSLEKKGLVKIELKTKNNRPVKILTITQKGNVLFSEIMGVINPMLEKIYSEISLETLKEAKRIIKNLRKTIENTVKVNI